MDLLEKLRRAWEIAPTGAKTIVYESYTRQNILNALEKGRRDEFILEAYLKAIKEASQEVFDEVKAKNEQIQKL